MSDVSVSQEQNARRLGLGGEMVEPGLDRPELAGPARRPLAVGQAFEPAPGTSLGGQRTNERGGPIRASIIDDDDIQGAWIVLGEQRANRPLDGLRLIAGRDDGGDRRRHRQRFVAAWKARLGAPKTLPTEQQEGPSQNGYKSEEAESGHARCLAGLIARGKRSGYSMEREDEQLE
jgi:hypothetical protein